MRQSVPAASPWAEEFGYVRAVRHGSLIEIGGTTAVGPDGSPVAPGDPGLQTTVALEIIESSLKELGFDRSAIVRTRFFMKDIGRWREAGLAHRQFFEGQLPTSSAVGGVILLMPELEVEIEATAWVE